MPNDAFVFIGNRKAPGFRPGLALAVSITIYERIQARAFAFSLAGARFFVFFFLRSDSGISLSIS